MSGPNDLGGLGGLGAIDVESEAEEPVFHAYWEGRMLGLQIATAGKWNIDMVRHARERQHPVDYMRHSYFENWLAGFEKLIVEHGLVTAGELARGTATSMPDAAARAQVRGPDEVLSMVAEGSSAVVPTEAPPGFQLGDRVRAVNRHTRGHTRQPRYLQGRTGVVVEHHGTHRFPDRSAEGVIEGRHLYTVRFEASELWGDQADGRGAVHVDLWEEYLEPTQ